MSSIEQYRPETRAKLRRPADIKADMVPLVEEILNAVYMMMLVFMSHATKSKNIKVRQQLCGWIINELGGVLSRSDPLNMFNHHEGLFELIGVIESCRVNDRILGKGQPDLMLQARLSSVYIRLSVLVTELEAAVDPENESFLAPVSLTKVPRSQSRYPSMLAM